MTGTAKSGRARAGPPPGTVGPAPAPPAKPLARLLRRCDQALARGDLAAARRAARRAIRLAPDHSRALLAAGRVALRSSEIERADHLAARALAREPGSAPAGHLAGLVAIACQDYERAESVLEAAHRADPGHRSVRYHLAETLRVRGAVARAYPHLRDLHRAYPDDRAVRAALGKCLAALPAAGDDPVPETDLLGYLDCEGFSHDDLSPLVAAALAGKWGGPGDAPDLDRLAADPLLGRALRRLTLASPAVESLITAIRRRLLIACLTDGEVPGARFELAVGIALHGFGNEYVYDVEADEQQMVDGLVAVLDAALGAPGWYPGDTLGAMLVAAMYVPLHRFPHAERLAAVPAEAWDPAVRPLLDRTLEGPRDEAERAARIPSVTPVRDPVSKAVRAQYEANPYPRWLSRPRPNPVPAREALRHEVRLDSPPPWVDEAPLRILVAGCGTGRQALDVADRIEHASVLAVDVSRRSLAYAAARAEVDGIANVAFRHGDILELDGIEDRFHLVYCSGVLHHLDDPDAGLAVLRGLLVPGGLVKLGLYSALARQPVARAREIIERMGLEPTPGVVRRFRAAVRASGARDRFGGFEASDDFYSMSGCRDLLFHVQEWQFSMDGIGRLCERHGIEFLGFSGLDPVTRNRYRSAFPSDRRMVDLSAWADYESRYPTTFAGMYNFWCREDGTRFSFSGLPFSGSRIEVSAT